MQSLIGSNHLQESGRNSQRRKILNFQHSRTTPTVGSGYDLEKAERNGYCISLARSSPVHFPSVLAIYNLSNAFTASSAVTFALAGLAPVTMRPSAKAKASQGLGGGDIYRGHISTRDPRRRANSHVAPVLTTAASIVGLCQLLI